MPERSVRILNMYGAGACYGVHNDSLVNLVRGVAERVLYNSVDGVLVPVMKPKDDVFKRLYPLRNMVLRNTPSTTVVAREDYPMLYSGRKRAIYESAVQSLSAKACQRSDSYCSTFVKAEKINFSSKVDPAPRVIQPRSPRYNVEVGRYLKCFEKSVFGGFAKTFGYDVILKGLNAEGVAKQLRENWTHFRKPVAIGLDASRFDQHVSVDALKFEHTFYNMKFQSPELARLLSWQLRNKGFGRCDDGFVKYETDGCRMSGDINTGLGNCIIMCSIVLEYFKVHNLKARLSNNGDDCIVICESHDLYKLDGIDAWFREFGFKLTREPTVDVFERVEFCQTQPVFTGCGWRMVRNPFTASSKDCVSLLSWANELEFSRWRNAIATCGLSLTTGVPFWEKFYRNIWSPVQSSNAVEAIYDSGMGYMARGVSSCQITPESRLSFYLAFGLTPDEQVALEDEMPNVHWCEPEPVINITDLISQHPLLHKPNAIITKTSFQSTSFID